MNAKIVLSIPGNWETRQKLVESVMGPRAAEAPEYLIVGPVLLNPATNFGCVLTHDDRDASLTEAFRTAGQGRFRPQDLQAIEEHKSLACLVLEKPSLESARDIVKAAAHLLSVGGLAVLVDSSGIAHPLERWLYYAQSCSKLSLYDAFITLVGAKDYNYTCGMHAFGMPDVSVSSELAIEDAPELLNAFNQWQLLESPRISLGQIFATGLQEPRFLITHSAYGYDADDCRNNPFGRYHLEPTDKEFPADLNYKANDEPLFSAVPRADTLSCEKQARDTLSFFLRHHKSRFEYGQYLFKTLVLEGEERAYMWLRLVGQEDDLLIGEFFEVPNQFRTIRPGAQLSLPPDEISDWCIIRNSTLIGGFSMRMQRAHVDPKRQQLADLYSGTISYAPLEELY